MPNCPTCLKVLRTLKQEGGLFFLCDQCGGRAVTIPQIQRAIGDRFVTQLLHQINHAAGTTLRKCPFCDGHMKQFQTAEPALVLDACKQCGVVWFDPHEFEEASERSKESSKGSDRFGAGLDRRVIDRASTEDSLPAEALRSLAAFLRLPF